MIDLKSFVTGLAAALSLGGAAQAATVHNATEIVEIMPGACRGSDRQCRANDRRNPANLIDDSVASFYALGLGGSVILGFGRSFAGGTLSVSEITFNRGSPSSRHFEAAEIHALDRDLNEVGFSTLVLNRDSMASFRVNSAFTYLKLKDVTLGQNWNTTSFDGFDIGKVSVAAVPVPAAGGLLLAALGGLAAIRRRKNAA